MLEVAEWLDVQRGMIAASESTFQTLDEEEGEDAHTLKQVESAVKLWLDLNHHGGEADSSSTQSE